MKLLVRLYRMLNRVRTPTAEEFDRLYRLDADPYGVEGSEYERRKADALVGLVAEGRYGSALDVGCGTGVLTRRLAPYCDRVLGMDFAPAALETARRETRDAHVTYAVGDVRELDEAGAHDLIVCSEVLYYLQPAELEEVIRRLGRALAPGGRLALVARADDEYVAPALERQLALVRRVEENRWKRPFAVTLWSTRAA